MLCREMGETKDIDMKIYNIWLLQQISSVVLIDSYKVTTVN